MSLLWTPPRKSRTYRDWHDPEWSFWAEPGIPPEVHKKLWPVYLLGVAFWIGITVLIWRIL